MASDKSYLTPVEVTKLLMVSTATVRAWAAKGLLPAVTTAGGHRRFLRSEVEKFATERGIDLTEQATGLRLLIVEDDMQLGEYLVELLEDLPGVEAVEIANNGFIAGQQVEVFKPTVVLLDLMMPGMDGFEVCSRLKANSVTQKIRVVAMTGYPSDENVNKILAAGAECCLAKPLDKTKLYQALDISLSANQRKVSG